MTASAGFCTAVQPYSANRNFGFHLRKSRWENTTEKEKETAQASVTQLEQENESVKTDLTKAQETVQNLNAVHPPRRFEDRNEIEAWLRNDDMSEREDASLAEGLLSKALEQQARALENGYIVSADYFGPDEDYNFVV